MKKSYFVRHGESKHNAQGLYAGTINSPLTKLGVAQAKQTGMALKGKNITHIICSRLDRAKNTAIEIQKIICTEKKVPIHYIPELREVDFGDIQNKKIQDIDGLIYGIESGTGDTIDALYSRAKKMLQLIAETDTLENVLIVGHGAFTAVIFAIYEGIEKHQFIDYKRLWRFENGELKQLENKQLKKT